MEKYTHADRWILASLNHLVERVTGNFENYEYSLAKADIESFFWRELTDNYLEMAKLRLYFIDHPMHGGARQALRTVLRTLLQLFAPLLPYVTEEIWRAIFADGEGEPSIHRTKWPEPGQPGMDERNYAGLGGVLIGIASAVRRYKSENSLSLGSEIGRLQIATGDAGLIRILDEAQADLTSITRARTLEFRKVLEDGLVRLYAEGEAVQIGILP